MFFETCNLSISTALWHVAFETHLLGAHIESPKEIDRGDGIPPVCSFKIVVDLGGTVHYAGAWASKFSRHHSRWL
jgi:hypothetical protein